MTIYLEGLTVLSGTPTLSYETPLQLASWSFLSRSLTYLLHRWHNSVRLPHTSYKLKNNTEVSQPKLLPKDITRFNAIHFNMIDSNCTWCSDRSIAGKGNSQNSHVTILWGQFSPLWTAKISRSIVSLQSEQDTC